MEISTSHDDRGLVLLCFEPAGEFCHHRLFAGWFEEQTGQHIPELASGRREPWEGRGDAFGRSFG